MVACKVLFKLKTAIVKSSTWVELHINMSHRSGKRKTKSISWHFTEKKYLVYCFACLQGCATLMLVSSSCKM